MPARRLRIRGIVQGVGFRHALSREARRLALTGWVRNRLDGSVEAVAVGPLAALDELQRWAGRGPSSARVDQLQADELGDAALAELDAPIDGRFRQIETC